MTLAYGFAFLSLCVVGCFILIKYAGKIKDIVKGSIRRKIALTFAAVAFTTSAIGLYFGYLGSYHLLKTIVSESIYHESFLLSRAVERIISEEIEDVRTYTDILLPSELSKNTVSPTAGMTEREKQKYFSEMDNKWEQASPEGSLHEQYLDSDISRSLEKAVKEDTGLLELFVTDAPGGLIAASGKTSGFYQGDELWWQRAIELEKNEFFIGGIEFDDSSGAYGITAALCLYNDNGDKTGVVKAVLDAKRLFKPLQSLGADQKKRIYIIDLKGDELFSPLFEGGLAQESPVIKEQFKGLIESGKSFDTLNLKGEINAKSFVAVQKIHNDFLRSSEVKWRFVMVQKNSEVFLPLKLLLIQAAVLAIVLLILLSAGIYFLSGYLSGPIKKFNTSVSRISAGNREHRVEIHTGDEIEELADNFNKMVDALVRTTVSLDELMAEVNERKRIEGELQESREYLKQKTTDLEAALEESSKTRSRMISMLDDNNQTRLKLEQSLKELKETQKMLIQSEKLVSLGHLVSEMAHEVNNPLMIISSRIQLMQMGDLKPEDREDSLGIIEKQCYRARDIIQRLLKFSKPSTTGSEEIDVNVPIEEALNLLEHQYMLENISIERNYAKDLPPVKLNKNEIEEVFLNLMKNAAEAMPDGGKITVTTSRFKDKVRVVFKDTGEGIPQRIINNIFDPFFTTKKEGTGLGLSVCYGIIKGHRGSLDYESVKGEGTSAVITLPRADKTS